MHIPVLLNEVIENLNPQPGECIVDGTAGGGGYSEAIAKKLGAEGMLIILDLDPRMLEIARKKIKQNAHQEAHTIFENKNFKDIKEILRGKGIEKVDGIVLDLGFASDQIECAKRGFSFLRDEPLIMTYSDTDTSVRELLDQLSEEELAHIIGEFSGERFAKRIAVAIKERQRARPINTSGELVEVVTHAVPKHYEHGRLHPATRTFLALRIYANHELDNLKEFLMQIDEVVARSGRVVIVSFHSLEDRLVKNAFRDLMKENRAVLLTKKPTTPEKEEIEHNPRARSAKLRAIVMN